MIRNLYTRALGRIRFRFTPQLQLVQVLDGDHAFSQSFKKVIAQGGRQISPLNLWHSFTKGHAGQYFLDPFPFDGVGGCAELVASSKKSRLFGFFRLDSCFDQFHQDAVCAGLVILRKCSHSPREARRK